MSFFKDFKEDLSQAVNELLPGEDAEMTDGLKEEETNITVESIDEADVSESLASSAAFEDDFDSMLGSEKTSRLDELLFKDDEKTEAEPFFNESDNNEFFKENDMNVEQELGVSSYETASLKTVKEEFADETAIITAGMTLTGNLESSGSVEVRGVIDGNVTCKGKLAVSGKINGNTNSAEFYSDEARIEGEIVAEGTVKVGSGSVIIGNVTATSAVIAGAIKGDIDVKGPVIVDASAIVLGNIKSRSVQINNGCVIEGFVSQCYADIDMDSVFKKFD